MWWRLLWKQRVRVVKIILATHHLKHLFMRVLPHSLLIIRRDFTKWRKEFDEYWKFIIILTKLMESKWRLTLKINYWNSHVCGEKEFDRKIIPIQIDCSSPNESCSRKVIFPRAWVHDYMMKLSYLFDDNQKSVDCIK